jgi:hypothetical protein
LASSGRSDNFSARLEEMLGDDWQHLEDQWCDFIAELDYGYDAQRASIELKPGAPLPPKGTRVEIDAARGWQSSGVRLEQGRTYRLRAAGRYQVEDQPVVWWSEPGGVSIRYHRGRPLGLLLAAVLPDGSGEAAPSPFLNPIAVGLGATLVPNAAGTLYLRINDSSSELADNEGRLLVEITGPW